MTDYTIFKIEYTAWPEGARIKSYGTFLLAAKNEADAKQSCENRWPTMQIERITKAI